MKTEFEVQFLKIDREKIIEKLKNLWAKCIMKNTLMKRVVFENPLNKAKSYLRVRDEWEKITCTYKEIRWEKLDINSKKEIETTVWDFDTMVEIFKTIWLKQKAYQESYRETREIDDKVFFMLDEWPWLKPFIEIEWESEEIVREYSKKLWFDYENAWFFGAVDELYLAEAWIPKEIMNDMEIITFENPPLLIELFLEIFYWNYVNRFLDSIFLNLKNDNIDVSNYELDHICYRVSTQENYNLFKEKLKEMWDLISENIVSWRPIPVIKLKKPIIYKNREISILEIPSPKLWNNYEDGLEHVEFVIKEWLEKFLEKYSYLNFDISNLKKEINPEIRKKYDKISVKFHEKALDKVIESRKNIY